MADPDPASGTLLLAKAVAMLVLGCGSLFLGTLPLAFRRYRDRKDRRRDLSAGSSLSITRSSSVLTEESAHGSQGLLTSLLLCFGGGVLLFTTFLHLAPEVRQSVERHQAAGQLGLAGSLGLADLLFCAGFFLVYLVEEAVHAVLESGRSGPGPSATAGPGDEQPSEAALYRTLSLRRPNGACGAAAEPAKGDCLELGPPVPGPPLGVAPAVRSAEASSARGLLTVLALSFHAIFEGLAVGLEPSLSSVVYLATAVATHKLVIAFCVGMELSAAGASARTVLGYLTVFSLVTPLGIGVGLALGRFDAEGGALGPAPTILQGMAAGTLLYVVFFEVLARERANDKSGLLQLLAIVLGFALMVGLQLATAHSHSHSHSHSAPDDEAAHAVKADVAGALASTIDQLGTWNQSGLAVSRNVSGSP